MRSFTSIVLLVLVAAVATLPITPAAPEHQLLAERMRSEGMTEHDIAEQLSLPTVSHDVQPRLVFLYSIFHSPPTTDKRDMSGDIAPGSLEAPEMLPRAAAPESFADTIKGMLRGDRKRREFAYEGKELEMRRPEGMKHWG